MPKTAASQAQSNARRHEAPGALLVCETKKNSTPSSLRFTPPLLPVSRRLLIHCLRPFLYRFRCSLSQSLYRLRHSVTRSFVESVSFLLRCRTKAPPSASSENSAGKRQLKAVKVITCAQREMWINGKRNPDRLKEGR